MSSIIVDTNSIIFAAMNNIDIFDSIKTKMPNATVMISKGILRELEKISDSNTKYRKSGRVALELLKKHNMKIVEDSTYADDWIVKEAKTLRCYVCTNDVALKRRLKSVKIKVLSVSRNGVLR